MSTHHPKSPKLAALTLGSIGVVYGDIGTSPLYAFRESLHAAHNGSAIQPEVVLGILSLIIWALIIIVTLKYVVLLLRADNNGEGGILSLMALAHKSLGKRGAWTLALGMTGAAMFYGDAIITPAISVLSAVEGVKLIAHGIDYFIIPISLIILLFLFSFQRQGTGKVSWIFGPIMALWFIILAIGGLDEISRYPQVLAAINPLHGLKFLSSHGYSAFITLGAVFLAVTGAEALYADLGHFGKAPIRLAWVGLVMPSLVLNYLGQGALVLLHPETAKDPFFLLYPAWTLPFMVILSTFATIIASQAVITGAYSLTHQAIQLGLLPRFSIKYTSSDTSGQIYIPQVNWMLLAGIILLIAIFHTSSNLASAYGIAVTTTMIITAVLTFIIMRNRWKWSLPVSLMIIAPLFVIDGAFLAANLTKVMEGGFIPLMIAVFLILLMVTWMRGVAILHKQLYHRNNTMTHLMEMLEVSPPQRIPGTAIYLSNDQSHAPSALLQNLKHYHVLHERNLILNLQFANEPYIDDSERINVIPLNDIFTQLVIHFGYMQKPNIPKALALLPKKNIILDMKTTTFFISRHSIVSSASFGMRPWQDNIFITMTNNANLPEDYFHLPRNRVVILGVQLKV